MSYRCDRCDKVRYGSELARVAEIRNVTYNRYFLRFNKSERKKTEQYGASFKGVECVKTEKLCEVCYDKYKDSSPSVSKDYKTVNFIETKPNRKNVTNKYNENIDIDILEKYN